MVVFVEIGGTNMRLTVRRNEACCEPLRLNTPGSADQIADCIVDYIESVRQQPGEISKILIACPGLIENNRCVHRVLYLPLNGVDLSACIENRAGVPTYVYNDANAQALGLSGEADNMLYLAIGTAVGGAVVHRGVVIEGHNGYAGEFGHVPVPTNINLCVCGRTGCLDTILSGVAFVRKLGDVWWERTEEQDVNQYLDYAGDATGRALGYSAGVLDPAQIVIAGFPCKYGVFRESALNAYRSSSWTGCAIRFEVNPSDYTFLGLTKHLLVLEAEERSHE